MTITDKDINRAVSAANYRAYNRMMDRMEEDEYSQEIAEEARATMPLTEMSTTLAEEYIDQEVLKILMADGSEWHAKLLTDRQAAELQMCEVRENLCKAYDIEHDRG